MGITKRGHGHIEEMHQKINVSKVLFHLTTTTTTTKKKKKNYWWNPLVKEESTANHSILWDNQDVCLHSSWSDNFCSKLLCSETFLLSEVSVAFSASNPRTSRLRKKKKKKEKVGLKQAVGFSVSLVMFDSLTRWTVTHQASMSMGFPRQECWIGLPFPSPVDLVNLRTEAASPSLEGRFFTT